MENVVRIVATCDSFTIDEQKPEKKALPRLKAIKKLFEKYGSGKLVVKTSIVNPSIF